MILAFDTATKFCSVALYIGGEYWEKSDPAPNGHAARLMPMIDEILQEAGRAIQQVDEIVVSLGPGSFTGLRIGISTALGLASALDIPVYGVSSLQARSYLNEKTVCPLIDARRDRVYAACYGDFHFEEANLPFEEFLEVIHNQSVVFTGEGIEEFADRAGVRVVENTQYAKGAIQAYLAGVYRTDITPRYLRMTQAEAEAKGIDSP
ncbi:MAG TPA: tRNA (adenosine(37)-N6)-threonylcarbamoyltransferase complex dimerization subunit type 1 TsaB [Tissierellia bacterium]|nr:tRNA (adenosine(37)-N6)-threonylcarbamoyltransferase complex dimerization subunit type 1 TsaB [Tissierellia bacterium]